LQGVVEDLRGIPLELHLRARRRLDRRRRRRLFALAERPGGDPGVRGVAIAFVRDVVAPANRLRRRAFPERSHRARFSVVRYDLAGAGPAGLDPGRRRGLRFLLLRAGNREENSETDNQRDTFSQTTLLHYPSN